MHYGSSTIIIKAAGWISKTPQKMSVRRILLNRLVMLLGRKRFSEMCRRISISLLGCFQRRIRRLVIRLLIKVVRRRWRGERALPRSGMYGLLISWTQIMRCWTRSCLVGSKPDGVDGEDRIWWGRISPERLWRQEKSHVDLKTSGRGIAHVCKIQTLGRVGNKISW